METIEVANIIAELVKKHIGTDPVFPSERFRAAGMDPLDCVEVALQIEELFDIDISDDLIGTMEEGTIYEFGSRVRDLIETKDKALKEAPVPRVRRCKQGGAAWNLRLSKLAEAHLAVNQCMRCGSPKIRNSRCIFCDGGNDVS